MSMVLSDAQVQTMASRMRELPNEQLASMYLEKLGEASIDPEPNPGKGRKPAPAPKRATKVRTAAAASKKERAKAAPAARAPRGDSAVNDAKVLEALDGAGNRPIGFVIDVTLLPRPQVQASLKRLEKAGSVLKHDGGKRGTTYERKG